ncbi:hypothetical protein RhiirA4_538752 [Rhizophagus irregularis]|uniref:Crinkler effector protein N-terminal domain-containing protein n=1 Tax=Rhizophagus irregularis TaxID=588596 RepID=A0A2I1G127_9GLOM|nr:hypothetical protein RhiirA4_538752 [Rhizophagus irregularis]
MSTITLSCLVVGENPYDNSFPVDTDPNKVKTVGHLRKTIKEEKQNDFANVDADKLKLWKEHSDSKNILLVLKSTLDAEGLGLLNVASRLQSRKITLDYEDQIAKLIPSSDKRSLDNISANDKSTAKRVSIDNKFA